MALMLSPTIAELLRELSGGGDVEEFIVSLIAERLDPPRRVEFYLKLSEDYLRNAEELYSKGDLAQAGEKYWGAVTALLNAIAEMRGWEHYSHRDYDVVIGKLYKEVCDKSLLMDFRMAEALHANFYRNFMDKEEFEIHRQAALELIERLRGVIKGLKHGS
ncbi:PaREP1 family protein [Vulcanisaeta distributa]|uniref:PaREP1 family protein n=1 Tax=Vulcanisaeta distributa (strain DSM 14429 / JCM 11212 / NBRC 100878 / IC-017) TaxID=572478 RepID=E1QQS9_VULDI|nr:PaREP1 family protein [Vulcanisaeta distributa]ADN51691.1 PaREP1 family protein [Vulcanisaeta distributa DSM 14429]